jgi:RimJ/RimL family protein N-acetyltransferase
MTDMRNVASQKVLEKVGMSKEGILRQNRIVHEEFVDEVWFGLLRDEWKG